MADYAARHPVTVRSVEHFDGGDGGGITFDVGPDVEDGDLILVWWLYLDTAPHTVGSPYSDMYDDGWRILSYRNVIGVGDAWLTLGRTWHTGDATSWTYSIVGHYTGGACGSGDYWVHYEAYVATVDLPIGGYFGFTASADSFFSLNSSPYSKQQNQLTAWHYYDAELTPGSGDGGLYGFTSTGDANVSMGVVRQNSSVDLVETTTLTHNGTGTDQNDGTTDQVSEYDTCVANGPFPPRTYARRSRLHNVNESPDNLPNRTTFTATWTDTGIFDSCLMDIGTFGFMRLGGPQLVSWSVNGIANNVGPDVDQGALVPYTFNVEHDRYNFDSVYAELLDTSDFTSLDLHDYGAVVGDVSISGDLQLPPGFEGEARVALSAYVSEEGSQFQYQDFNVIDFPVADTSAQIALRSRRVEIKELPHMVTRRMRQVPR